MIKPWRILKGWGKALGLIRTKNEEAEVSGKRLVICGRCPFSKDSKVLLIIHGHAKYEHQLQCTKCKCPCLEKSLVMEEKCPVGRW